MCYYFLFRMIAGFIYSIYCLVYHLRTGLFTKTDIYFLGLRLDNNTGLYHRDTLFLLADDASYEYTIFRFIGCVILYSMPFVVEFLYLVPTSMKIICQALSFSLSRKFIKDYPKSSYAEFSKKCLKRQQSDR